jgi:hypothetical protein
MMSNLFNLSRGNRLRNLRVKVYFDTKLEKTIKNFGIILLRVSASSNLSGRLPLILGTEDTIDKVLHYMSLSKTLKLIFVDNIFSKEKVYYEMQMKMEFPGRKSIHVNFLS